MNDSPEIQLVRANNPGPLTGAGTNTWIFGRGETVVIDPGPADELHLQRVLATANQQGRVVMVACTHHHLDHLEGAARFCELVQAPLAVYFRRATAPDTLPVHDGDHLLAGHGELVAVHTPGHASDHLCFLDESSGVLFTGDHVLQGTTSVVAPPDGDMTAYLDSLERVRQLRPSRLLPGHGDPIESAEAAIGELIAHRRQREQQILGQLELGAASPEELVGRLYASYSKELQEVAAGTVLAHLLKLEQEGRVRQVAGGRTRLFERVGGTDR